MTAKCIFIILDGLSDRPIPLLGGQTPLEAAATPNLNQLAASGVWGMVVPTPEGHRAHTHTGVSSLFGLHPDEATKLSRGPIEMAGLDWEQSEGDVAMRANLAHLERRGDGFLVLDRRAGRIESGTEELALVLQEMELGEGVQARFRATEQHRGVLCLSGPGLCPALTDTDPGNVSLPAPLARCEARTPDSAAQNTARLVNRFTILAHQRLQDHPVNLERVDRGLPPANGLIVRGAGVRVNLATTAQLMNSSRTAVIAGCTTVKGLARLFGFRVCAKESFTGAVDTDLAGKMDAALAALPAHDFVYLHVKAPDIYAHEQDADGKRKFLERFDRALTRLLDRELIIAVCADHGTDSNTGWHIDDPVPAFVSGVAQNCNNSDLNFSEVACAGGPLGTLSGAEFLQRVRLDLGAQAEH